MVVTYFAIKKIHDHCFGIDMYHIRLISLIYFGKIYKSALERENTVGRGNKMQWWSHILRTTTDIYHSLYLIIYLYIYSYSFKYFNLRTTTDIYHSLYLFIYLFIFIHIYHGIKLERENTVGKSNKMQ